MIRPLRLTLLFAALAALAMLTACAARRSASPVSVAPGEAWSAFRRDHCVRPAAPGLLLKASLYYTRVEPTRRTNRTTVTLWGDFDGPMRLDVAAGVGGILAHIREDGRGLLAYYPDRGMAYAHRDALLGAARLGMPFPFSLNQLARVAAGDFSGLTPARAGRGEADGVNFRFAPARGPVTAVVLDPAGRPVLLRGRTGDGAGARTWTLAVDAWEAPGDGGAPLPGRLTLTMGDGETGVLRIRSRALRLAPWPARALDLALPEGTVVRRLDRGGRSAGDADIPVIYEDK